MIPRLDPANLPDVANHVASVFCGAHAVVLSRRGDAWELRIFEGKAASLVVLVEMTSTQLSRLTAVRT